jgi:hypothetical protein
MLLNPDSCVYDYFNSDIVIIDGWSTAEVEACLAKLPTIVMDKSADAIMKADYMDTVKNEAVLLSHNIKDVENHIFWLEVQKNKDELCEKQEKYIQNLGIIFDGNIHNRILSLINNNF